MSQQENKKENDLVLSKLNEELRTQINQYESYHGEYYEGVRERQKEPKSKKNKKKIFLVILGIICVIILSVIVSFFCFKSIGNSRLDQNKAETDIVAPEGVATENDGRTVNYNGKTYQYNDQITTILCIGVDKEEFEESDTFGGANGQADSLFLVVIERDTGKMTLLPISRYTMTDVDAYTVSGELAETKLFQIGRAYAWGEGTEKSCENVMKSASRLFYGMPIAGYVAIDLSAVSSLNDAVGGVTVDVCEDLSAQDPELTLGNTVTLTGAQATTYVRSRKSEGKDLEVDNNAPRMQRQKDYVYGFANQVLSMTKKDITVPISLMNAVSEDMITDITPAEVTALATVVVSHGFSLDDIHSMVTTAKKGEEHTEVYPDETALYELVLDVFYKNNN